MRLVFQLLLLIAIALASLQLLTSLRQPAPEEPIAALEIMDTELPTRPERREATYPPVQPSPLPQVVKEKPSPAPALSESPAASSPVQPTQVITIPIPQILPPPFQLTEQEIYARVSGAIIQIFCTAPEELFSASGVILNERGLVLTNAHVAEIVKKVGEINCQARHGNPADLFAKIEIVFIASTTPKIPGSGKVPQRDFAFLRIMEAKEPFRIAGIDIAPVERNTTVLTLGYPSEFLQGINASVNSNLVFSALTVAGYADVDGDLDTAEGYVFKGGLVLQQGSSGTALFNRSGKVVGLIFATTKGETTADRDGIALMTHYIDSILRLETGEGLMSFIDSH